METQLEAMFHSHREMRSAFIHGRIAQAHFDYTTNLNGNSVDNALSEMFATVWLATEKADVVIQFVEIFQSLLKGESFDTYIRYDGAGDFVIYTDAGDGNVDLHHWKDFLPCD